MSWLFLFAFVIMVDLALSGDNVVVVAAAANQLPPAERKRALMLGIGAAVLLRVVMTGVSGWLMGFKGVAILGGVALLWIAYKMAKAYFRPEAELDKKAKSGIENMAYVVSAIVFADISMSMDNVAAIAAMTRGHPWVMAFGLLFSVAFMFIGATFVSMILEKYKWVQLATAGLIAVLGVQMMLVAFFSR